MKLDRFERIIVLALVVVSIVTAAAQICIKVERHERQIAFEEARARFLGTIQARTGESLEDPQVRLANLRAAQGAGDEQ
jgi:hypothetical protein